MKIQQLLEEEERNLIGHEIKLHSVFAGQTTSKIITSKTKDESWHGTFDCSGFNINSLRGAPYWIINGSFLCSNNPHLSSLKGAPKWINGSFFCSNSGLKSLKDIHKIITEVHGNFFIVRNPIESHLLGLLYIKGLKKLQFTESGSTANAQKIINNHLPNLKGHKGVFECQCELQDAGYDDYAQL